MTKKLRILGLMAACFTFTCGLHGQETVKPKSAKNASDPAFTISPEESATNQNYQQLYRPQFHYTPIQGFVGDATGLIYDDGTYHLFYMSDKWERRKNLHKCWGHATSTDLLHWSEQSSVLDPVTDHKPGSGSGIVDWDNVLGLAQGNEKTLAVFYTDYQTGSCILYSTDHGKTWARHPRNPVLPRVNGGDRDPQVFWYAPAKAWRMVRHAQPFDGGGADATGFMFYASTNLLDWTYLSKIGNFNECPDIFELPVDGHADNKKWVLMDASYDYLVGNFDGTLFLPETEKIKADAAAAHYLYAPQTWKRTRDGSLSPLQMGFMRFPKVEEMPVRLAWYNQMTFPVELSLKTFPDGLRVCREPIAGIQKLYQDKKSWDAFTLKPGDNPLADLSGEQLDIEAEFDLGNATGFNLGIRGQEVRYSISRNELNLAGTKARVALAGKHLRLRLLVDHSSLEVFANYGQVSISRVFFFNPAETHYSLNCVGGEMQVTSLTVHHVGSIWPEKNTAAK